MEWPKTRAHIFKTLGLSSPRGILLYGPPGCAKTSLARASAGSAGVAFISLSPADVYASSYVGEAEAVIRRVFTLARSAAPCILFFDEIDSILGNSDASSGSSAHGMNRGGRGSSSEARVLSTFLNEMDGVDSSVDDGVLVLAATNRPNSLDAALLRPGRFDYVIYVPLPDEHARYAILQKVLIKSSPTRVHGSITDADLRFLANEGVSGGFTGAEIVNICQEASMVELRARLGSLAARIDEEASGLSRSTIEAAFYAKSPRFNDVNLEEYKLFSQGRR